MAHMTCAEKFNKSTHKKMNKKKLSSFKYIQFIINAVLFNSFCIRLRRWPKSHETCHFMCARTASQNGMKASEYLQPQSVFTSSKTVGELVFISSTRLIKQETPKEMDSISSVCRNVTNFSYKIIQLIIFQSIVSLLFFFTSKSLLRLFKALSKAKDWGRSFSGKIVIFPVFRHIRFIGIMLFHLNISLIILFYSSYKSPIHTFRSHFNYIERLRKITDKKLLISNYLFTGGFPLILNLSSPEKLVHFKGTIFVFHSIRIFTSSLMMIFLRTLQEIADKSLTFTFHLLTTIRLLVKC